MTTASGKRRLRVGAVSYLNTKPLVYRLEEISPRVELLFDLPSRLADDLSAARLDVALIPSIEFFQDPAYRMVSNACIACRGPVLSVKLLSRRPPHQIRSLALDEGSRTSAALVRILLQQRFGLSPRLEPLPLGTDAADTLTDAVLLIGDRAIQPPADGFTDVWDLGDEWCRWAELPFVFAMWVARPGVELGDVEQSLAQARDAGVERLDEIAATEAAKVGMSTSDCHSYLKDNLHFFLGAGESQGLRLFHQRAVELGFAPALSESASH